MIFNKSLKQAYSNNVCLTNQPANHAISYSCNTKRAKGEERDSRGDIREDLMELRDGTSGDDGRLVIIIIIYSLYKVVHA